MWYDDNLYDPNPFDIAGFSQEPKFRHVNTAESACVKECLSQLEKYHFHVTSSNSPFTKMSNIERDSFTLYDKGDNLAAFLYGIREILK